MTTLGDPVSSQAYRPPQGPDTGSPLGVTTSAATDLTCGDGVLVSVLETGVVVTLPGYC